MVFVDKGADDLQLNGDGRKVANLSLGLNASEWPGMLKFQLKS